MQKSYALLGTLFFTVSLGSAPIIAQAGDEEGSVVEAKDTRAEVTVSPVRIGSLRVQAYAFATVVSNPRIPPGIVARSSGIVREIAVAEGDHVTSGTLVAQLDAREAQALLAKATQSKRLAEQQLAVALKGGIESVQQELDSAASKLGAQAEQLLKDSNRVESLRGKGMVSEKDATDARIAAKAAADDALLAKNKADRFRTIEGEAQISSLRDTTAAATADLNFARVALDNTRLAAPEIGQIGKLVVSPGMFVDAGSVIAAFSPESPPLLEFSISQHDADNIVESASIHGVGEYEDINGKVILVSPRVDQATGLVRGLATLAPVKAPSPRIGSVVPIEIETKTSAEGFVMPASALSFADDEPVVATVDGDHAKVILVEVVARTAKEVCVTGEGLATDSKVISDGNMNLPDGSGIVVVGKSHE